MATEQGAVTVYVTDTCPWCDRTKAFLRERKVPFVEKNVALDRQAAMEMVQRSGQQGVPVVTTDNDVIVGFDQVRLTRLAEKFGGPVRPPLGLLGADLSQYLGRHPELRGSIPPGTTGVYVGKVRGNTVAERAGLQPGDVVTGFAGKRVRSMADLDHMISTVKAGESMSISVLRDGSDQTLTLQF